MQKSILFNRSLISYNKTGDGDFVFLINGFAEDATIFNNLISDLQTSFTCITIDLPGTGKSPYNEALTNIPQCANIINAIMEQENISHCPILGHSMGGYIALEFANKYPTKINALGLLHSTAAADNAEKILARKKNIEFIKQYGSENFLTQSITNLFAKDFVNNNRSLIENYIKSLLYINSETLIDYSNSMMQRKEQLTFVQQTKLPTLYIIGKKDKAIPFEIGITQSHLPNFSYIHILNNVGHMGMIEDSPVFNKYVNDFLVDLNFINF